MLHCAAAHYSCPSPLRSPTPRRPRVRRGGLPRRRLQQLQHPRPLLQPGPNHHDGAVRGWGCRRCCQGGLPGLLGGEPACTGRMDAVACGHGTSAKYVLLLPSAALPPPCRCRSRRCRPQRLPSCHALAPPVRLQLLPGRRVPAHQRAHSHQVPARQAAGAHDFCLYQIHAALGVGSRALVVCSLPRGWPAPLLGPERGCGAVTRPALRPTPLSLPPSWPTLCLRLHTGQCCMGGGHAPYLPCHACCPPCSRCSPRWTSSTPAASNFQCFLFCFLFLPQVVPVYSLPEDGSGALIRAYTMCPAYDARLLAWCARAAPRPAPVCLLTVAGAAPIG